MEALAEKTERIAEPVKQPVTGIGGTAGSARLFSLAFQAEQFERARFGWMAILLTIQSCIGALACMFISLNGSDVISLSLCAALTMGSNALFIALATPRICLIGFYLSVVLNTILIFSNI